jgi:hypothetical protein
MRQLTEIRAAVVELLSAQHREPDLHNLVSDAIFGNAPVDELLADLGIRVAPPTDSRAAALSPRTWLATRMGAHDVVRTRGTQCRRRSACPGDLASRLDPASRLGTITCGSVSHRPIAPSSAAVSVSSAPYVW